MRNLQHQYYIVGGAEAGTAPGRLDFKEQMLINNSVPGILPVRIELEDNDKEYFFCTDGSQSVEKLFERRKMSSAFISALICKIVDSIAQSADFFLCENDYVITPEAVFTDPDALSVGLVYVSGYDKDLRSQLEEFLEYVMEHLDYNDRNASYITYSVYAKCKKEGVTLGELSKEAFKWQQGESEETGDLIVSAEKDADAVNLEEAVRHREQAANKKKLRSKKDDASDMDVPRKKRDEDAGHRQMHGKHRGMRFLDTVGKAVRRMAEFVRGDDTEYDEDDFEPEDDDIRMADEASEPQALAYLKGEAEKIPITEVPFFVGRIEQQCDLYINSAGISRYHAKIGKSEDSFVLADLNTSGGTYLNEIKLEPGFEEPLMDGDEIRFADYRYIFCLTGDKRTA